MGYVEDSLVPGESLWYRAHISKLIFLPGLILCVVLVGFLLLPFEYVTYRSTEMAITNRRVITKRGVFSRRTWEMNLAKIENVNVEQGVFARMFGYGRVTITGTGATRETFGSVANPLGFRKALTEAQVATQPIS